MHWPVRSTRVAALVPSVRPTNWNVRDPLPTGTIHVCEWV